MKTKTYSRSMAGGVVSPAMVGRIDDSKRDAGVAAARNILILPEGIGTSRPGTKYVSATKTSSKRSRVMTFRYSSTQTLAMEFGEAYIRFHSFGQTLLTPTTGVSAWNSGDTYSAGDLVTDEGSTWYAVTDVPANKKPNLFTYGAGEPIVTGTWVLTTDKRTTPPPGYDYVGTELPSQVDIGRYVYIQETDYVIEQIKVFDGADSYFVYEYVPVTVYYGFLGTAGASTPATFWYEMPTAYEIPSPYAEADLFDLHYVQSGDVFTIAHPKYAPRELRRLGATTWVLTPVTFGSTLSAPAIASVTPTLASSPSDDQVYSYVATNVSDDQNDESVQSAASTANNQLLDTGAINTITFGAAARRNVYRLSGGLYGYIGQTVSTTLIEIGRASCRERVSSPV